MEAIEIMKLEHETIKFKVSRVVKKQPLLGPVIFDFYATVLSYHPLRKQIREVKCIIPLFCVSATHMIPTTEGYVAAENIKEGDIILSEINLITQ